MKSSKARTGYLLMSKLDFLFDTLEKRIVTAMFLLAVFALAVLSGQLKLGLLLLKIETTVDLFKLAEPKISEISLLTRFLATYLDANFSFLNGIKALINSLRIADLGFVAMLIILLQGDKKTASEKIPYRICATVVIMQTILYSFCVVATVYAYRATSGVQAAQLFYLMGIVCTVITLIEMVLIVGSSVQICYALVSETMKKHG